jgi:ribokinase
VKVAVVGHVEWVQFARVDEVPAPGDIVHAEDVWEEAGGGGAVAAVQLARLAGSCVLFTALGGDDAARRSREQLEAHEVRVHAARVPGGQRRVFTFVDAVGERTITVLGNRQEISGQEELPWQELAGCDAVYFVSGGRVALRAARRSSLLVASARAMATLRGSQLEVDALVGSGRDPAERYQHGDLEPVPKLVVTTAGALGGWAQPGGPYAAAPLPAPPVDAYGCGDSFAAGLTFALARGDPQAEAIAFAAECGAAALTGRGAQGPPAPARPHAEGPTGVN